MMMSEGPNGFGSRVTRLETRVDDLTHDMRALGPLVRENVEMRTDMRHLTEDVRDLQSGVTDAIKEFRGGLDQLKEDAVREAKERQRVREDREEKERQREAQEKKDRAQAEQDRLDRKATESRDRWARWVPTIAVLIAAAALVIQAL